MRVGLPLGCSVLCYADDILLVVRGPSVREAAVVVGAIKRLGLEVSIGKTEAIAFMCEVLNASIRIGDAVERKVELSPMKYRVK